MAGNILTGCCGGYRSDPDALVRLDEAAELFGVIDRQVTVAKPETVRETPFPTLRARRFTRAGNP